MKSTWALLIYTILTALSAQGLASLALITFITIIMVLINVVLELDAGFRGKKFVLVSAVIAAKATVSLSTDGATQRFATALTASRAVTFTTASAQNGDKFRISRSATGLLIFQLAERLFNKAIRNMPGFEFSACLVLNWFWHTLR